MPEAIMALETELVRLGARLKTLRAERGWTLDDLAARADLSPPYLSRLEAGDRQPSLAALISLAQAFELPLTALFEAEARVPSLVTVTRAGSATRHAGNEIEYVPLTGGNRLTHLNAVLLTIPAIRKSTELHHHDSEELVFILSGRAVLTVADERITLETGDSATYDARHPHRMDALDNQPTRVLLVASTAPKAELTLEGL
jgi:transcriptional regulator with XRE-family HTH domain